MYNREIGKNSVNWEIPNWEISNLWGRVDRYEKDGLSG